MVNIQELFSAKNEKQGKLYGAGWEDAICFIMDNYEIKDRDGEPIQISFNVEIDEDEIVKKLLEKKDV